MMFYLSLIIFVLIECSETSILEISALLPVIIFLISFVF